MGKTDAKSLKIYQIEQEMISMNLIIFFLNIETRLLLNHLRCIIKRQWHTRKRNDQVDLPHWKFFSIEDTFDISQSILIPRNCRWRKMAINKLFCWLFLTKMNIKGSVTHAIRPDNTIFLMLYRCAVSYAEGPVDCNRW